MNDDHHLLEQFRQSRSEVAFRALVERYLRLVYASAIRVLNGDIQSAEDVTQMVFLNLARKAPSLPKNVVLAGWLYRDARFTALELLRKESRRARREKEAATMQQLDVGEAESEPARLRPLLDELLEKLQEIDRNALVLRFFQGCDFRAVGAALGSTEDTARKRVERALEKLQGLAKHRGITLSIAGLGIMLAAEADATLPPTLAATVSSLALTNGKAEFAKDLLSIVTKAKATSLAAALAALMATGLLLHNDFVSRRPVAQLQQQVASQTAPQSLPERSQPTANPGTRLDGFQDAAAQLWRALHELPVDDQGNAGPNKVYAALRAFGRNSRAAIPTLLEALQETNATVQMCSMWGFHFLGRRADEAIPELTKLIGSGNEAAEVRIMSMQSLASLGIGSGPAPTDTRSFGLAVRELTNLLSDSNTQIRREASVTLGSFGNLAQDAVPALHAWLSYSASQEDAIAELKRQRGQEAQFTDQDIARQMDSLTGNYRLWAAQALNSIGFDQQTAAQPLEPLLSSTDKTIRVQAALALWKISGRTDGLDVLIRNIYPPNADFFYLEQVGALGEMGKAATSAVPVLQRLSKWGNEGVREPALDALQRIGAGTAGAPR